MSDENPFRDLPVEELVERTRRELRHAEYQYERFDEGDRQRYFWKVQMNHAQRLLHFLYEMNDEYGAEYKEEKIE